MPQANNMTSDILFINFMVFSTNIIVNLPNKTAKLEKFSKFAASFFS